MTAAPRMTLSSAGRNQLIHHEGTVRHYYNDAARNCTYGVGTLAHLGRCTPQEMHKKVSNAHIVKSMAAGIHRAEVAVRHQVNHQHLNQHQFDALVSFTYNMGPKGAHHVLSMVNHGQLAAAGHQMNRYIHATVRGKDGHPMHDKQGHIVSRVLPGLVTRRANESRPFLGQVHHAVHPAGKHH